jgi:hypothetical protein
MWSRRCEHLCGKGNIFVKDHEQCLPLFEGKMIWYFDHRFGTYEGQIQAQANQGKLPELNEQEHQNPFLLPISQYWIHESDFPPFMKDGRKAILVFWDVTNAVLLRSGVFCILPVVPCGHKLPIVVLDPKHSYDIAYLSTCFSSFIFDYVTRQNLEGTSLSYFILKQIPVLLPKQFAEKCHWDNDISLGSWILPRALELTYTAWDLEAFAKDCGYDGPPFRWDEKRRFLLRCELDAAYFHLYGIARDDVDYSSVSGGRRRRSCVGSIVRSV